MQVCLSNVTNACIVYISTILNRYQHTSDVLIDTQTALATANNLIEHLQNETQRLKENINTPAHVANGTVNVEQMCIEFEQCLNAYPAINNSTQTNITQSNWDRSKTLFFIKQNQTQLNSCPNQY